MSTYEDRIREAIHRFSQPGDDLACFLVYRSDTGQTCGMCGHHPIHNINVLINRRSNERLKVGSECIHNYKRIHEEEYGSATRVFFPPRYQREAHRINGKNPGTVTIAPEIWGDKAAMDMQDDFRFASSEFPDDFMEPREDNPPEGMGPDDVDWEA
jgi:hypothetical protein